MEEKSEWCRSQDKKVFQEGESCQLCPLLLTERDKGMLNNDHGL